MTTTIAPEKVAETAFMARLGLSEQALEDVTRDMSKLFTLLEKLDAVDTTGVAPMAHPLDVAQPLREDNITSEVIDRDTFQSLAPVSEHGYYVVPKVIDEA